MEGPLHPLELRGLRKTPLEGPLLPTGITGFGKTPVEGPYSSQLEISAIGLRKREGGQRK